MDIKLKLFFYFILISASSLSFAVYLITLSRLRSSQMIESAAMSGVSGQ